MSAHEEHLKRTELKYFGTYILYSGEPGTYALEHDETEEEMLAKVYQEFEACLEGLDEERSRKIQDAAGAIGETNLRAGFFPGLKAGARLLLNLLSDREVIY